MCAAHFWGAEMADILNALVLIANFIIVPGFAYGSQLALGVVWASAQLRSFAEHAA